MGAGFGVFLESVALYSIVPILIAIRPGRAQFVLFYAYVACLLTLGGLLGAVYVLPVVGDVEILAGQVTYGGFVFATVIATIVGREVRVIRNVIILVILVDSVVYLLFAISSRALADERVSTPFDTPVALFEQQLRTVVTGGALIVIELLLLFWIIETAKRRLRSELMIPMYVVTFVAVLVFDGALFLPLILLPDTAGLGSVVWSSVQGKAVLAAAFSIPLVVFLAAFRPSIRRFEQTPLEWPALILTSRDEVQSVLSRQKRALAEHRERDERRLERTERVTEVALEIAGLDTTASIDVLLEDLSAVLGALPGVRSAPLGLSVRVDGSVASVFGSLATSSPAVRHSFPERALAGEVWHEMAQFDFDPLAHVPIIIDSSTVALLDVRLDRDAPLEGEEQLRAVVANVATVLASQIREICDRWSARAPIIDIIENRSLNIVFQPVVDLVTDRVVSVEALSRFHDGTLPADRFAEAERVGLSVELELLAVREALRAATGLPRRLRLAINLSPHVALDDRLDGVLATADRPITIEITEHRGVDDYDRLVDRMRSFADVRLAVDDAGSGYATLSHVLRLRPQYVKLDRTWVAGIHLDRPRQVLVSGLLALATELVAEIVAEGIENRDEVNTLQNLGIRYGQGFLLGRPVAAPKISFA